MEHKPIASLIYDFDKTLSPNNMQEYGFMRGLNIEPAAFWGAYRDLAVRNRMDEVLAYMYMMMEKARGIATDRMVEEARQLGADAIVCVRFASSSVMQSAAEVMAYGTAVKFL